MPGGIGAIHDLPGTLRAEGCPLRYCRGFSPDGRRAIDDRCHAGGTGWPLRRAGVRDSAPFDAASPPSRPAPERGDLTAGAAGGVYQLSGSFPASIPPHRCAGPRPICQCRRTPDRRREGRYYHHVGPTLRHVSQESGRVWQSHRGGRHRPRPASLPHRGGAAYIRQGSLSPAADAGPGRRRLIPTHGRCSDHRYRSQARVGFRSSE